MSHSTTPPSNIYGESLIIIVLSFHVHVSAKIYHQQDFIIRFLKGLEY